MKFGAIPINGSGEIAFKNISIFSTSDYHFEPLKLLFLSFGQLFSIMRLVCESLNLFCNFTLTIR